MPKSFYLTSTEREIASSHHGTKRARLTQDAQRPFDSCGLCLAPLVDPVASPSGYLFCRECILENLLTQTQALTLKRKAYEGELKRREREAELEKNRPAEEEKARFEAAEKGIGVVVNDKQLQQHQQHHLLVDSTTTTTSADVLLSRAVQGKILSSTSAKIDPRTHSEKAKDAASTAFWTTTPSVVDEPKQQQHQQHHPDLVKPDPSPRDPVSGSLLRLKELLKVNFTWTSSTTSADKEQEEQGSGAGDDVDGQSPSSSIITKEGGGSRISCPVCFKAILWQRTFLLKTCGHVLCEGCVSNLCLPSKECAVCSSSFPPDEPKSALLALQVGGSSFSNGFGTQAESSRKTYTNLIT